MSYPFNLTLQPIGHGHDGPPVSFIELLTQWGKIEDEEVFAHNDHLGDKDIYNVLFGKLGPYPTPLYRRAVMMEAMRCIGGDEADWNWKEGRDTTAGPETPDQMEAGFSEVSFDSRFLGADLQSFLTNHGIVTADQFQQRMKEDPMFAMGYTARLLRDSTRWDGPTNRGWIYNQVRRDCVQEFMEALAA